MNIIVMDEFLNKMKRFETLLTDIRNLTKELVKLKKKQLRRLDYENIERFMS